MQNPLISIQWLVQKLHTRKLHLKARDVILSGAITEANEISGGDNYAVTIEGLGTITSRFTKEEV